MANLSAEGGAAMVSAYLEILAIFPTDILEKATFQIRCSGEKYAPSAGVIFDACMKMERKNEEKKLNGWGPENERRFIFGKKDKLKSLGLPAVIPESSVKQFRI